MECKPWFFVKRAVNSISDGGTRSEVTSANSTLRYTNLQSVNAFFEKKKWLNKR